MCSAACSRSRIPVVSLNISSTTGIRDLEQAAEHLAAHALYLIEVDHVKEVVYNADMVKELFSTHH